MIHRPAVGKGPFRIGPRVVGVLIASLIVLTACSSGFRSVGELSTAQIDSIEDLEKFLGCGGIGSFTHVQVADAGGALELATDLAIENPVLQGHSVFVEAVSIGGLAHGPEAWVIVDAEGFLVGDVDTSGYVFLCENKPADYKPVDVGTPYPPCEGPDERNDPECRP